MSFICEEERMELLEQTDVFFMSKIMFDEKIEMEVLNTGMYQGNVFLTCLLSLQEKYPYFKVRPSKNEDFFCIITVSLPRKMKPFYGEVKKRFTNSLENSEFYYGEIILSNHYNELHVQTEGPVFFHDILQEIVKDLKALDAKEVC
jgi:hypothetical protein